MNKKLRKLLNQINGVKTEIKNLVDAGDLDGAEAKKAELVDLQREFDILKDIEDEALEDVAENAAPVDGRSSVAEFANAFRELPNTNMLREGANDDGGYTVPQDVQTKINQYKDAHRSMRTLCTVETVKTNKGSRVYQTKTAVGGFDEVDENGLIQAIEPPKFEQIGYTIKDYAGYMPVTNDLLKDSDANIERVVVDWIGRNSLATDNRKILALIAAKAATQLSGVNGIKHEINVTLGSAYRANARIVTNDDGLDYLDTLEDEMGRPYLNPDPTANNVIKLRVGATAIIVEVFPNADMPSADVYELTSDVALDDSKTYYERTGSGTDESPYVYAAVETPDVSDIATYYEITGKKIPFVLGDLKEAFHIYDRQQTTLYASNDAAVSDASGKVVYNAFAQRGRLYRADMRADYKTIDSGAFVNGYIQI